METGKTGRYIKYAIGEIVLVVIGILIALSINNWNEKRIAQNLENDILIQIFNDLNLQEEQFNFSQKQVNERLEYLRKVSDEKYNTKSLDSLVLRITKSTAVKFIDKGFLNLKELSKSSTIVNANLFNEISFFYEDEIVKIENFSNWEVSFVTNTIEDYVVKNLSIKPSFMVNGEEIKPLLINTPLMSIVNYQLAYLVMLNNMIEKGKQSIKDLRKSIQENQGLSYD